MAEASRIERLPVADVIFLLEERTAPQTIALLGHFGGPAGSGGPTIDELRTTVAERLAAAPVLRRRVHWPGWWRGRPLWVDDDRFTLADHVRAVSVPEPGDEVAVLATAGGLLAVPLDQRRPLWELVLLDGTADGRPWLVWKLHHVVADGEQALALLGALVDPGAPAVEERWRPAPVPSSWTLASDAIRRDVAALSRALGRLSRPRTSLRGVRDGLAQLRTDLRPSAPRLPFNRPLGPRRRFLLVRADLDPVRAAAHRRGATVNDVAVAAMAAGVVDLLRSRHQPTEGLVLQVSVPVSLRHGGTTTSAGNAVGGMRVPVRLDLDPDDAVALLDSVASATRARKAGPGAAAGFGALGSELMPIPLLRTVIGRALTGEQRFVNVYVSDLVGPTETVRLTGFEIAEAFPIGPLSAGVGLGATVLSYAGTLSITVLTDPEACPDADVVAAGMERFLQRCARLAT